MKFKHQIKRKLFIALTFIFVTVSMNAQVPVNSKFLNTYNAISQERVFIHSNSNVFITGEELLYSFYCINNGTGEMSDLSKVGYVQLLGPDRTIVFEQKIRLEKGKGAGDFKVPANLATGNYKLIGFTQWMRNGSETHFFLNTIQVFNPFLENQKIKLTDEDVSFNRDSIEKSPWTSSQIVIDLDTRTFTNRTPVSFKIRSLNSNISNGNYSISVRKVDEYSLKNSLNPMNYTKVYDLDESEKGLININAVYPPEFSGELVAGIIKSKNTDEPAANKVLSFSIPGKEFMYKITKSNALGVFYFDIEDEFQRNDRYLQLIPNDLDNYSIEISNRPDFDYNDLEFEEVSLPKNYVSWLKNRAVHAQIENAYAEVKQHKIIPPKTPKPFYTPDFTYVLDEYKRFPTIKETMIEVIDNVWVVRRKGKQTFEVREFSTDKRSDYDVLILIDGVQAQNQQELYDFDPLKIHSISVITDRFTYYDQLFGGVIIVETKDGLYKKNGVYDKALDIKSSKSEPRKTYFSASHSTEEQDKRIPDFRRQLYWNPFFSLENKEENIEFYTSDIKGIYKIQIEGFMKSGRPVYLEEFINVE